MDTLLIKSMKERISNYSHGIIVVSHGSYIYTIFNKDLYSMNVPELIQDVQVASGNKLIFGFSFDFSDFSMLRFYARQARLAMENAGKCGNKIGHFTDIYLSEFQTVLCHTERLRPFLHQDVVKLKELDEQTHGELIKTLYVFLLSGCNYRESAAALNIHRNTLAYRVEKIRSILTLNLDDLHDRQILISSLMISASL